MEVLDMPTVNELYQYLDRVIPSTLSESWDNDGLMCCPNPERTCHRVLLALDATEEAVSYAVQRGFDIVVTHHPLIFHPIASLTQPKLISLAASGISVFSFHTRLDAVKGGVNDCLARKIGLRDIEPFGDGMGRIGYLTEKTKIETFACAIKQVLSAGVVQLGKANEYSYRVAVLGGAGSDAIEQAMQAGADTFLTGELHHHELNEAPTYRMNLMTAGHHETENPVLTYLDTLITEFHPGIVTECFDSGRIIAI